MSPNRTVLVTGCSDGGLGSSLAIALKDKGWRVFASARNLSKLDDVKAADIECVLMDVSSDESITAAALEVKKLTGGSLDALINNAGGGYSMPILDLDLDKTRDLFELNVFSIVRVTKEFTPLLLNSKQNPLLINNTSGMGMLGAGIPFQGAYAASKSAATSITESLRIELAPFGIRVVNLATGGVKSGFHSNLGHVSLPANSMYNLAKAEIESPMAGNEVGFDKQDASTWAKQVAADLSQRKPPYMISRGKNAGTARVITHFPLGTMDGALKHMTGIDVLEKRLKENSSKPDSA